MIKAKYYNEYIETREPLKKKKGSKFRGRIHFLGYLDGLYNEEEYKRYVPNDEECISLYAKGYNEGKIDRENKTSKLAFTKSIWLSKLATKDYENGFRGRNLSPEAEELYNLDYDDLSFYEEDTREKVNASIEKNNIRF